MVEGRVRTGIYCGGVGVGETCVRRESSAEESKTKDPTSFYTCSM